ncbi:MAG: hypothetical protein GXY36_11640 [Chloroflexi bacterium]|nr:hypothetical protein [Chloroflexota bacterium]
MLVIVLVLTAIGPVQAAPRRQDNVPVLSYGQSVDGAIHSGQPSLFYSFDAAMGDAVTITMTVTGGDLDPFLVLNDASQSPLMTDDNGGGELNAQINFPVPAAGQYVIQATHAGGTPSETGGTFRLSLSASEAIPPEGAADQDPAAANTETAGEGDVTTAQGDAVRLLPVVPGETVRNTLDRQVAVRYYWFEGQADAQVNITPEQLADFMPLMVLYDAGMIELQRADPGISLRTALPEDGLYFLAVSLPHLGSSGGGFGFLFGLSGTLPDETSAIDILYGQSQQGTLDSNLPAVTYRFRGSAGDQVAITMSRAGGDLDSYLYLMDASGALLYEDNDSGGQNGDARIVYTLPADGEYLIVATRVDQEAGITSGSYLLDLVSDAAPPPVVTDSAEPVLPADYEGLPTISFGATVEGTITPEKFADFYVFLGEAGETITIDLVSLNEGEANALDPTLILLDDARIPLAENDDVVAGQQRNSRLEFTLPRTTYYVIVATRFDQDQGTSNGPYALTLSAGAAGEIEAEATAEVGESFEEEKEPVLLDLLAPSLLETGTPIQATLGTGPELYTFTADEGDVIDLAATADPGLDVGLILADADLNEIVSSSGGTLAGVRIPATGAYLVMLTPRFGPAETVTGGYILALAGVDEAAAGAEAADGPRALAYGETAEGVIDDETVSEIYTFTGAAGDQVRITMEAAEGSTLDCYLQLQDANGEILDANDDIDPGIVRDSRIEMELPAAGEYVILVSRYVGNDAATTSGAYVLRLEQITEETVSREGVSTETVPIMYGQTLVGELNAEQYLVFYVFDGVAGDVVTIEIENLSDPNLDSVLHLYQSSGAGWVELAKNDDSPFGGTYAPLLSNVMLPATGKYLIAISRYEFDDAGATGRFSVTLSRAS